MRWPEAPRPVHVVPGKSKRKQGPSKLETLLVWQIHIAGLPAPEREHRFHPSRGWRFDCAWPAQHLAVEVEGGIHCRGRHVQPAGYAEDCSKYNEAALLGWRVLRVTAQQIRRGLALQWVERALGMRTDGACAAV